MSISATLLPEFDAEMASTRKVLERVTDELLEWQAHEKSMSVGKVSGHLADIPAWVAMTLEKDELDVNPPGGEPYRPPELSNCREILECFDRNVAQAKATFEATSDEEFGKPWSLLAEGQTLFTMPKLACIRTWILNHTIHHRAHLCVYLRLNDIPVPGMYGPSADDDGGM